MAIFKLSKHEFWSVPSKKHYHLFYKIEQSDKFSELGINVDVDKEGKVSYYLWLTISKLSSNSRYVIPADRQKMKNLAKIWQAQGLEVNDFSGQLDFSYPTKIKREALEFISCLNEEEAIDKQNTAIIKFLLENGCFSPDFIFQMEQSQNQKSNTEPEDVKSADSDNEQEDSKIGSFFGKP